MRRRQYLLATGAALGVAGCSSDEGEDTLNLADSNGGRGGTDNNGDQSATRTPRPAGDAEIVRTDLIRGESIFGEIPWALVDVENMADADHGQVEAQVRFYNDADDLMATRSGIVDTLPAGERWRYYQRFATQDRGQLASIETSILDAEPRPDISTPAGAAVTGSEMTADPDSGVTVTGTVDVSGYSGNLSVIALCYDADGRLRGTIETFERDLQTRETWRFDAAYVGIRTPQDRPQVTDHEILLDAW